MDNVFRYTDGRGVEHDVELIVSVDDLDIDAAEALEEAIGADMRQITSLPLSKQLRAFVFASVRRADPDATLRSVGRVKLGPLLAAFTNAVGAANATADAEGRAAAEFIARAAGAPESVLRVVTRPDADPLVSEPGSGTSDGPARPPVEFTGRAVVELQVADGAAASDEVLSPTSAGSDN